MSDDVVVRIRLVVLGRGVQIVSVSPGATLQDALASAGVGIEGKDVRVNGRSPRAGDRLGEGDLVTVIPLIRGG